MRLTLAALVLGACSVLIVGVAHAQRVVAPETTVFQATRDGVVTITCDRGSGSGFIVNRAGLILTNSHVIENTVRIAVQLDDSTRTLGRLVGQDGQKDLAIIWIAPALCASRPALKLADRPALELAFEGEKVIAIGSPLNQTRIMTSGIVSKVEEDAIISDLSINPGNSGGPLLNMDAEVIAINTFRDPSLGGPGVSGSVSVSLAEDLLADAKRLLASSTPPEELRLPVLPQAHFPLGGLEWASERSCDDANYQIKSAGQKPRFENYYSSGDVALDFTIWITTPTRSHFLEVEEERRLTGKRNAREVAAGIPRGEMYDPLGSRLREWQAYVGQFAPVVTIDVVPKIGETGASVFGNALAAALSGYSHTVYYASRDYKFKADLQDCTLLRNEEPISEVFRGLGMMPVSLSAGPINMEDIAQRGTFVYLPEVFAPADSVRLYLKLKDLKHPDRDIRVPIPDRCRDQIWLDFEPYRDMLAARLSFPTILTHGFSRS